MTQALSANGTPVVWVFGTGGTISGRSADPSDVLAYTAGEVSVADLLVDVAVPAGLEIRAEQVAQVDSKDMTWAIWRDLAQRIRARLAEPQTCGVVITHGTDTMEETAYCLHWVLGAAVSDKPVVLTGAMRPASALAPDGPQNMADALLVAAEPSACGVLISMAGQVWAADQGQKLHSGRLDAFGARDGQALAEVRDGVLTTMGAWPTAANDDLAQALDAEPPWVEIVFSGTQADGRALEALVQAGVEGMVLATTGNGTVHQDLLAAAESAHDRGLTVIRASRTAHGHIRDGHPQKIPHAAGLSPFKARVEMMLRLAIARSK